MITSRIPARAARTVRVRPNAHQLRHESTHANPGGSTHANAGSSGLSQGIVGGLVGGGATFAIAYSYYHFSGAKTIVSTAKQTQRQFQQYKEQFKQSTPEPSEALQWLRQTATSYAAFIPGGKGYVDTVFNDISSVQEKHGPEVDRIVKEAYDDFKGISHEGLSAETAYKAWEILSKHMKRIGELASDSMEQIVNNHPMLKEKVGGNMDQLKKMGENYGPEAKKQVEETWEQVQDVLKGGFSASTIPKIQSLVQDKVQKMQEFGNKAWEKGMEQAKPYLDKSPKVKELIEKNTSSLKQGNVTELYSKIKDAVQSGSTGNLEQYIKSATDKAQQGRSGGGLESWMKMIPGGGEIMPQLSQLQQIASEHGEEAEKIAKSTFDEIQQVLQKKVTEAQNLANKAKKKAS